MRSPAPYAAAIETAAARHGLDPKLLRALVLVESGYRPDVVSPAGASGLTQLMPATAQALGVVDRFDPEANLIGGADYLARQLARFQDVRLALAAYNAGPARIPARGGGVPPILETRQYVGRVVDCYLAQAAGRAVALGRGLPPGGRHDRRRHDLGNRWFHDQDDERDDDMLTRAEASAYLARFHVHLKPATLARMWSVGSPGPPCQHIRRKPMYPRGHLRYWALSQSSGLRRSRQGARRQCSPRPEARPDAALDRVPRPRRA